MPPKKGNFTYSINPELYARAHKPASTIAMGMKGSQASSQCWADQVQREDAIRDGWAAKYDPEDRQAAQALQALEQTQARDAARHAAYVNPANNPELYTILYKTKPSAVDPTLPTDVAPPELQPNATSTDASPAVVAVGAAPAETSAAAASSHRVRRAAEEYLEARCDNHTLQQRYPDGPVTAAQAVGWGAATAGSSDSAVSARAASHRRAAGAYRKPEDEEHAALLGFDYTPK